ncbi:MAG: hypothetical protein GY866_15305 [Proteobacteria bacterium]|nr:hypothetical protein [Pseudomonadota bacterium]
MRIQRIKPDRLSFGLLVLMVLLATGCVSHLKKGWNHFEKGEYLPAQGEWAQSKEPVLAELVAKAGAADAIVNYHRKIEESKASDDRDGMLENSLLLVAQDKWANKDWLQRSPLLQKYLDDAHISIEEEYFRILSAFQEQKNWDALKESFFKYKTEYCGKLDRQPSQRNVALLDEAEDEIEKERRRREAEERRREAEARRIAKLKETFDRKLKCGKNSFMAEEYEAAMECLNVATEIVRNNPDVTFDTDELEYVVKSTEQAIDIRNRMEEEKLRVAAVEKERIEEELKEEAERLRKIEEEKQRIVEEKIRLARAAEAKRLKEEEEKRRKEAERQRKIEEKKRRWRAFLKKGAPLKPLVTTVMKPSKGSGSIKKKKKKKWQGGSQLPKPKDKTIASEDVYALGVEIPKEYKLTYLRNYYDESKNKKNMLKAPVTQGGKRNYYTEEFKGGRYYIEVQNQRSVEKNKYELRSHIYKIPVTH